MPLGVVEPPVEKVWESVEVLWPLAAKSAPELEDPEPYRLKDPLEKEESTI